MAIEQQVHLRCVLNAQLGKRPMNLASHLIEGASRAVRGLHIERIEDGGKITRGELAMGIQIGCYL